MNSISPSGDLQNHGYKTLLINRFRLAVVPVGSEYRENIRRAAKRLRIFIQKWVRFPEILHTVRRRLKTILNILCNSALVHSTDFALVRSDRYAGEATPLLMYFTEQEACGRNTTRGNAKAVGAF